MRTLAHRPSWQSTFSVTVIDDNGRFIRTALHPYTQVPGRLNPDSLRRSLPLTMQNAQQVLFQELFQGSELMKSVGVCSKQYADCGQRSWLHPLQAKHCKMFHINSGRRLLQHRAWQYCIQAPRPLPSPRSPSRRRSGE